MKIGTSTINTICQNCNNELIVVAKPHDKNYINLSLICKKCNTTSIVEHIYLNNTRVELHKNINPNYSQEQI